MGMQRLSFKVGFFAVILSTITLIFTFALELALPFLQRRVSTIEYHNDFVGFWALDASASPWLAVGNCAACAVVFSFLPPFRNLRYLVLG
jgi:hypothetical protein